LHIQSQLLLRIFDLQLVDALGKAEVAQPRIFLGV